MTWKEIKEALTFIALLCIGIAALWSTVEIMVWAWG